MISADILGERSRLTPDKTALVYVPTQERFTYRELNERVVQCGRMLLEGCGLKKGDRVGILAHNRVEFLEVFFAAGKTGLVLVPLNTRLTPHELEFIVRDSTLSAFLYGGEFSDTVDTLKKKVVLKHWISLDEPLNALDTSYRRAIETLERSAWGGPHCDPEDLYCLLYTSGTTGKPKGVMIPHRMVAWNGYNQGYGLTEVGVNCFSMTLEESVRKAGSIGKQMMLTEARLVDAQGRITPAGEVGELLLRGPHVSLGYWKNSDATAAALDKKGWFHTSDLARCDEEGFFYIAGRKKDMIISGGVNVYPAEIEGELLLHPGIKDAAVIGVPDPTWGEVGVAFLVVREGWTVSKEELSHFLANRIAKYKIPKEFILTEAVPRTLYGKAVKSELQEQYLRERGGKSLSR